MYCRVIRLIGSPEKADEGLKLWTNNILPTIKKQHGFAGVTFLSNRETGEGLSVTYWETEKAMKEAREQVRPEALKVQAVTGSSIVEEDECEVAVLERFKPAKAGTWIRVNTATTEGSQIADAISYFKTKVVPATQKQPGVRTAYTFVNRQTGRTFSGSTWDTQKDLQNSAALAADLREEAIKAYGLKGAKVETFEVVFTEIPAPAPIRH